MNYTYKYPRPSVTVDATVFRKRNSNFELLLIQRGADPFKGEWALPGGFMDMDETLEEAIVRELREETNLSNVALKQLQAFSTLDRDPRGRTISVIFTGIYNDDIEPVPGDDAHSVKWFNINKLPDLAFDHDEVIAMAINNLERIQL